MEPSVNVLIPEDDKHFVGFELDKPHRARGRRIYGHDLNDAARDFCNTISSVDGVYAANLLPEKYLVISLDGTVNRDTVIDRVTRRLADDDQAQEIAITRTPTTITKHKFLTRVAFPAGEQPKVSPM